MTRHTEAGYRDASLAVDDRVEDLLGRLTVAEKAGQLTQYFYLPGLEAEAGRQLTEVVELAIESGAVGSVLAVRDPAVINRLQQIALDSGHGIPLLIGFDVIHGLRTIFPVPIALTATWSPDLVEEAQRIAAREARAVGIHWTFAPMIDIARDPRWGRMVEGSGEDPFLAAAMAAAQVRGFQSDLGPEALLATAKHFAGYGAARGGRDYDDVELSDSEFWNVYLPPFQAAVDAGVETVMSAYMDLNGVPASGNRWLLTDVLRAKLGFDGVVVSDNGAVRNMVVQHFAASLQDSAERAVEAGLDMEMCVSNPAFAFLPESVLEGRTAEGALDAAVRRVLRMKFRLGLFENVLVPLDAGTPSDSDQMLNQSLAERSIVLLKNDGALPLDPERISRIALIGQLAESERDTLGPWVFGSQVAGTISILSGLRAALGPSVKVDVAPGAGIPEREHRSFMDANDPTVAITAPDYDDDSAIDAAVAMAGDAGVAIVVVGQRQNQSGELASTDSLSLPGRQLEQLKRIAETGATLVILVMSGRPLDLRWADANAAAIVQVWHPGTMGGAAIADILLGHTSPSGRLPFSWPRHVGQIPMIYAHNRTFHPELQHQRYFDGESTPLYPFGFGLSYAAFEYSNFRLERDRIRAGESTNVSVDVVNTSNREADEVAQLYIHQRWGSASRPVRELKGFRRVSLAAGERRTVTFEIGPPSLRYWNSARCVTVQEPSEYDIWVGGDSRADLGGRLIVEANETSR